MERSARPLPISNQRICSLQRCPDPCESEHLSIFRARPLAPGRGIGPTTKHQAGSPRSALSGRPSALGLLDVGFPIALPSAAPGDVGKSATSAGLRVAGAVSAQPPTEGNLKEGASRTATSPSPTLRTPDAARSRPFLAGKPGSRWPESVSKSSQDLLPGVHSSARQSRPARLGAWATSGAPAA